MKFKINCLKPTIIADSVILRSSFNNAVYRLFKTYLFMRFPILRECHKCTRAWLSVKCYIYPLNIVFSFDVYMTKLKFSFWNGRTPRIFLHRLRHLLSMQLFDRGGTFSLWIMWQRSAFFVLFFSRYDDQFFSPISVDTVISWI